MRVVMTGGSSGIGLRAARALGAGGARLAIGTRSAEADVPGDAEIVPLDLADLDSVRSFAERLGAEPIDVLIGNAGTQFRKPQRSRQGYELTFATNHLAHYLLVRLLLPSMAPNGRIVLTGSGTHDPAQNTGMPPPRHADAMRLAYPDRDPDADAKPGVAGRRAYSTSKLCNLMTVRELARRAGDRPDLAILAFDPAFVPGTGLARDYGPVLDWVFRTVFPIVVRGSHVSTPDVSGKALAALSTDPAYAERRGEYWSVRSKRLTLATPSELARDDAACARLWDDSARLVGLAP
jgi:NAD(P)-dependent dehydrogenase (short-subunit alcohol dehydrogenase family)